MRKNAWDEKTMYQDESKFFGFGMSGYTRQAYWEHQEDKDKYQGHYGVWINGLLLEIIPLWF